MNITHAELRDEGRLYLTIDGTEYLSPGGKAFILVQGAAYLPEELIGETFAVFIDPADEDSYLFPVENATRDPVYVDLCRQVLAQRAPDRMLKIPSEVEALSRRWHAEPNGILRRLGGPEIDSPPG